jgi:hypothetical protein
VNISIRKSGADSMEVKQKPKLEMRPDLAQIIEEMN